MHDDAFVCTTNSGWVSRHRETAEIEAGVDGIGWMLIRMRWFLFAPAAPAVLREDSVLLALVIPSCLLPFRTVSQRSVAGLFVYSTTYRFLGSFTRDFTRSLPLVVASVGRSGGTDRGAWVVWIDWIYWITGQELSRVVSGEW